MLLDFHLIQLFRSIISKLLWQGFFELITIEPAIWRRYIWSAINMKRHWTLLPLKVLVPCILYFFRYWSIKEHFTSIVGPKQNIIYNCQSLQLRNNGFRVLGELATANPSKVSLSQFCTMSTFHMARALLTKAVFKFISLVWVQNKILANLLQCNST
jgi:hypothetical protein